MCVCVCEREREKQSKRESVYHYYFCLHLDLVGGVYAAGLGAATHHSVSVLIEFWRLITLDQTFPVADGLLK